MCVAINNKTQRALNINMIQTRDAHTDDEAWMLEKLNQDNYNLDNFNPRDFRLAVNEDTGERLAFGRTQYHRNVDDIEYVEIGSFVVLERSEFEHGCQLLVDLAEQSEHNDVAQVFSFPHNNHDTFREVGFEEVGRDRLPTVMQERLDDEIEKYGDSVIPMVAEPKNVEFEDEDEDEEFVKPEGTDEEEIEKIKDELNISENANTKYST